MPKASPKLEWCVVRVGEDVNWWVEEISDPIHWDVDGLGILDPRQISHLIDLCDPLREYGFDPDLFEQAFFVFTIEKELTEARVRLRRVRESLLESEDQLFALPDVMDEERGPYAEFLDQITRFRIKMLNDLIDFEQNLTVEELEEEIRERQNSDFMEARGVHFFTEISAILEYVPDGFELDLDSSDDEDSEKSGDDLDEIPDFEDDEKIEEDETMKWDEDEEEEEDLEEEQENSSEDLDDFDDDEEEEKPTKRR